MTVQLKITLQDELSFPKVLAKGGKVSFFNLCMLMTWRIYSNIPVLKPLPSKSLNHHHSFVAVVCTYYDTGLILSAVDHVQSSTLICQ